MQTAMQKKRLPIGKATDVIVKPDSQNKNEDQDPDLDSDLNYSNLDEKTIKLYNLKPFYVLMVKCVLKSGTSAKFCYGTNDYFYKRLESIKQRHMSFLNLESTDMTNYKITYDDYGFTFKTYGPLICKDKNSINPYHAYIDKYVILKLKISIYDLPNGNKQNNTGISIYALECCAI